MRHGAQKKFRNENTPFGSKKDNDTLELINDDSSKLGGYPSATNISWFYDFRTDFG